MKTLRLVTVNYVFDDGLRYVLRTHSLGHVMGHPARRAVWTRIMQANRMWRKANAK